MDNHLDRQTQPEIYQIENIKIPEPVIIYGKNGVPFHIINMSEQDVVRIDIMISAGKWEQKKLLTAMFTNLMLKEGVEGLTSQQVAEQLDYLGAWLQPSATFHNSYITLYSLNKYSKETFSLLEKIVKKPLFPEEEFETIKNRRKQNFIVENEKVEVKEIGRAHV